LVSGIISVCNFFFVPVCNHQKLIQFICNFIKITGPFKPQSATWKNLAVSYLTVPDALRDKKKLIGGLRALCMYINHESKEVDRDPQVSVIIFLDKKICQILTKRFYWC
jgi:hypothetical protein